MTYNKWPKIKVCIGRHYVPLLLTIFPVLIGIIGGSGLYNIDNLTFMFVTLSSWSFRSDDRIYPEKMSTQIRYVSIRLLGWDPDTNVALAMGSCIESRNYRCPSFRRPHRILSTPWPRPHHLAFKHSFESQYRRPQVLGCPCDHRFLCCGIFTGGNRSRIIRHPLADYRSYQGCSPHVLLWGYKYRCSRDVWRSFQSETGLMVRKGGSEGVG